MNRRSWTRAGSGLVAAFAAAALVGLATPAHADETPAPSAPAPSGDPAPSAEPSAPAGPTRGGSTTPPKPSSKAPKADVSASIASSRIAFNAVKTVRVDVRNDGPSTVSWLTAVVDFSALSRKVRILLPGYCKLNNAERRASCRFSSGMSIMESHFLGVRLEAHDVPAGEMGRLTITVSSETPDPDLANNTDTAEISVVGPGVDLLPVVSDVFSAEPGKKAVLNFYIGNFGSRSAQGLAFKVTLPKYVSVPEELRYEGCTYSRNGREVVCFDDITLDSGFTYYWNSKTPFEVVVASDAPGPVTIGTGVFTAGAPEDFDAPAARGARKTERGVVRKASQKSLTDADPGDNSDSFQVSTSENPADLAVTASKANGAVGDTVTVTVAVKNNGPADSSGFAATVTAPAGTELVDVPKACTEKTPGKVYVCQAGNFLDKGEAAEQVFTFKITSADVGGDGKVTVSGKIPDRRTANNTAKISINDTGGSGGGLPVTGYQVSLVAGTGAALLLAGGALVLISRRRRTAQAMATTADAPVAAGAVGGSDDATT